MSDEQKITITPEQFLKRCDAAADLVMLAMEYAKDGEYNTAASLAETATYELMNAKGEIVEPTLRPRLAVVKRDA